MTTHQKEENMVLSVALELFRCWKTIPFAKQKREGAVSTLSLRN